ncbi:MAG: carboxylating nicotinate-nucleotide diphosphorylase [Desulfobacteraceae bacterium]
MSESLPQEKHFRDLIRRAVEEDLGSEGDVTSLAVISAGHRAEAVVKAKEPGVLSGVYLMQPIFRILDAQLSVEPLLKEGAILEKGSVIARIYGSTRGILAGERVVLNFIQRLSGIATRTARLTSLLEGTEAVLLDTRKTTPGLRLLEKQAVRAGGGSNHRSGLYDMILIKDTHLRACGGPAAAVKKALSFKAADPARAGLAVEVEVQTREEFLEALEAGPDRIMLDNMGLDEMRDCVRVRDQEAPSIELEASGNITEETIREVALTGVDFISSGGLTHSVRALDIHLVIS